MVFHQVNLFKKLIVLFILCASPLMARAQRTTSGGGMIGLEGFYPLGAGLSYGQYLPSSFWEAGVNALLRDCALNDGQNMQYMPLCAFGNWLYRIAGTRSRSINLYAGAGAFLGWEFCDPCRTLPDFISDTNPDGTFLYGISAKIQLQAFLSRSFSVLLSGVAPINFTSPYNRIQPCASLGLRLDL